MKHQIKSKFNEHMFYQIDALQLEFYQTLENITDPDLIAKLNRWIEVSQSLMDQLEATES